MKVVGSHGVRIIVFLLFFFPHLVTSMAWKYGPLFALASFFVAAEDYTLHEFPGSNRGRWCTLYGEVMHPLKVRMER